MGTVLTVIGITIAVAVWDLTGETAAEYVAKYIVDQDDLGASSRDPVTVAASSPEPAKAPESRLRAPEAVPVLLAATAAPAPRQTPPPHDGAAAAVKPIIATSTQPAAPIPREAPLPSETVADPLLSLIGDTPHRRPDGTVFMPIAAQRVFGFRTVIGERVSVPATVELPGRIVVNPSTAHLIQSSQEGFIEVSAGRFPYAGQKVKRGELLATLRPSLTTIEKTQLDARMQELTDEIDLTRKRMARLEEVMLVRYRASRIEQMRVEIEGLRRQLAILRSSVERPIELRAQTDGVVSHVKVTAGQYVHAGHTIFEIVDPTRLWVSASAFEPGVQERLLDASAITADGTRVELRFVGGGLALQHQALALHFEIAGTSANLVVDTPVTVVVQVEGPAVSGLRVPRSSLTRTSDGRELIWERRSAETFVAHHVTAKRIDAAHMLVTSSVGGSARIVTTGVATLGQVQ